MPGRAADLIEIPDSFWQRAQTLDALRARDMGRLFHLLRQYAGTSQTRLAIACDMTQPKISGIMRGTQQVTALGVFERIADGLNMPNPARLAMGLAPIADPLPQLERAIPPRDIPPDLAVATVSDVLSADPEDEENGGEVRRRTFVGLTGASLFGALLAEPTRPGPDDAIESLTAILAAYSPTPDANLGRLPDLTTLSAAVTRAKQGYQACRYTEVAIELSPLLTHLQAACTALEGDPRLQAYTLAAEAYQVAGSILLKVGDPGLAWLAADRSMQAAQSSQDPITIGSSARIITHAMMNGAHHQAAAQTASTLAATLDHDVPQHTAESLSVYGSLLLRGASAAAKRDDRHTANELLTEAESAGRQLGDDLNLRWTAFGPTNARLHRVNIAVTLGDAGTALDLARTIDLEKITITERKAAFLIDTARAFLQCGKHEKAYLALRAAEQMAHEEIAGRPSTHRVINDLITTAPPSIQRHAEAFGRQLGVPPVTKPACVLTHIVCGAGPAADAGKLVKLAQQRGWTVQMVATPAALDFLDVPALEAQTGSPVRSQYRKPGEPRSRPADAIIVAPATYNTINKWANGISDTYALGILAETTGLGVPTVVLPFVNTVLGSRRPFRRSIDNLRAEGVNILLGTDGIQPHEPHTGGSLIAIYPWHLALNRAEKLITAS